MSAGLPGLGLSGAFFIISALLALPIEVVFTLRGRSSLARWRSVLRNVGIALTMIAGLALMYTGLQFVITKLPGRHVTVAHTTPVIPLLGTLGLVAIVILGAKSAQLISRKRAPTVGLVRAPDPTARSHVAVGCDLDVDALIDEPVSGRPADTNAARKRDARGAAASATHAGGSNDDRAALAAGPPARRVPREGPLTAPVSGGVVARARQGPRPEHQGLQDGTDDAYNDDRHPVP